MPPPAAPPPQDPSDKSFIQADATLQGLMGEPRFKGFGFMKLLAKHLTDPKKAGK